MTISAPISIARSDAAVSVVKYGLPVPAREDHQAPLLQVADGAAPDVRLGQRSISIADSTRVFDAARSSASCSASEFITVASMPM